MDNLFTEGMMQGPDGSILRFFYDSERNEAATQALGRAIFDTILYCDIITPGQKSSTPRFEIERIFSEQSREVLKLTATSKRSYKYADIREQVDKFKANEASKDMGGTPLKMWPRMDRGMVATLNALNIFTVEALAGLSDANMQNLGLGALEMREQAKEWLKKAEGDADTSRLVSEKQRVEAELQRVNGDLSLANDRIAALEAAITKLNKGQKELSDII